MGGEGVEGDDCDPGTVALTAGDYPALLEGPYGDQVVLAACHDQLAVGGPADAEQTTEVRRGQTDQLHGVVVEHAQATVLRNHGQVLGARREGKVVDGSVAYSPPSGAQSTLKLTFLKHSINSRNI